MSEKEKGMQHMSILNSRRWRDGEQSGRDPVANYAVYVIDADAADRVVFGAGIERTALSARAVTGVDTGNLGILISLGNGEQMWLEGEGAGRYEFADVEARRSGNDLILGLKGSRNVRGRGLLSPPKSRRWRDGEQGSRAANDEGWRRAA